MWEKLRKSFYNYSSLVSCLFIQCSGSNHFENKDPDPTFGENVYPNLKGISSTLKIIAYLRNYIVTYCIKLAKTSWPYSMQCNKWVKYQLSYHRLGIILNPILNQPSDRLIKEDFRPMTDQSQMFQSFNLRLYIAHTEKKTFLPQSMNFCFEQFDFVA